MQASKDLVLGKVWSKVSLHFTRDVVVVTVPFHRATALAPHLNMSRSPVHPPASEACGTYSSNQAPRASLPAHRDAIHNRDYGKFCPKYDRFALSDHPQVCRVGMSLRRKLYHDDPTQRPSWKVSSMSAGDPGPLATSGKVRVWDRLVRVNGLDCQDWNLQRIKNEVLGKEGSEVRLVFGKVMGSERMELLRVPTTKLTLVDPMEASWSSRTPDAEEVAIQPEPLANSSASEILNTATASTSVPFHPPAAGKGTQCEKTGELEPSDLSKLRITAEIFTGFKSPTTSGSLQPATPAAGSSLKSPAVLLETILCPTNSTTSLNGASFGEVAITETQEQNDSWSAFLLPKEQIPKRGSKRSYMEGRCIIQVGNVAHWFKLCESVTVGFILEDLSVSQKCTARMQAGEGHNPTW